MRAAALLLLALVLTACGGGLEALVCYTGEPAPGEPLDGDGIYSCSAQIGCPECGGGTSAEIVAASSYLAARDCWEQELQRTTNQYRGIECIFEGIYHPDPGGKPNATKPAAEVRRARRRDVSCAVCRASGHNRATCPRRPAAERRRERLAKASATRRWTAAPLVRALKAAGGNASEAARMLGVSSQRVFQIIETLGLRPRFVRIRAGKG